MTLVAAGRAPKARSRSGMAYAHPETTLYPPRWARGLERCRRFDDLRDGEIQRVGVRA